MCKKSVRKRFDKISNNINGSRVFNTKLGPRCIKVGSNKKEVCVTYYDADNSELFHIGIEKSGKINIYNTKIDKPEIFLAIYEIENIINNKIQKKRDIVLEKLFENIDEFSFKSRILG